MLITTSRMWALLSLLLINGYVHAAPIACPFDKNKSCNQIRDILNDVGSNGLKYYAPTNYDHRMSGEINVYDATLVQPYQDSVNAPGQIKFLLNRAGNNYFKAGEFMTRRDLDKPPFNAPVKSNVWTTKEAKHGYIEVRVKMPKCDNSTDNLCQAGTNPQSYNKGLWPAIWMMPTNDANWPYNAEIDISEAYLQNTPYNVTTATLHFNGNDGRCQWNDCVGAGFDLAHTTVNSVLHTAFRTWGFEWQPDPASASGGQIITGYLDNQIIWGPLRTDTLPADGKNALSRGFNDPNGGYYLIVNLAVGGPYAGAPDAKLQNSSMYVQSVKAYSVDDAVQQQCLPPINIQSMYWPDKKQVVLGWQAPTNGAAVTYYQVNDWQNRMIWRGSNKDQRTFIDASLPGSNGKFTYFLLSNCNGTDSQRTQYDVNITLKH